MEVCGQIEASADLPGGIDPQVHIGREAGWDPKTVRALWRTEKSYSCWKSNPGRPARRYTDWATLTHQDKIRFFKIIRLFFCTNAWCIFLFFNSDFFPKIQLKRVDIWLESQSTSIHDTCCHCLFHNLPVLFERTSVCLERNWRHPPSARQHQSQVT
jgi:hypothetical protein